MSHHGSGLVCHHSYPDFCESVLVGCVSGSLFKCDAQFPIVALGLFFKFQIFATVVHPDNVDPILLPLLELLPHQINHSVLRFIEINKLQLCSFVNENLTVLIVDGLDIFRLLDGTYVEVNLSLAILFFHFFFGNIYSLLFCFSNHASCTDTIK
jgi:hypothetical protein